MNVKNVPAIFLSFSVLIAYLKLKENVLTKSFFQKIREILCKENEKYEKITHISQF